MSQSGQSYQSSTDNLLLSLSPMRSGTFGSRNNDDRFIEHVKSIKGILDSVSMDIKATKADFADLSTRSKDNGRALEKLMREIKGVREDDGVSQKLTGLAQLDRLDQLSQLGQLKKLNTMEEVLKNILNMAQQNFKPIHELPELSDLKQLGQLSLLEHLKKLELLNPMNSKLKDLEQLNRLEELSKLKDLKKLEELTQLKILSTMQNKLCELSKLNKLENLDELTNLSNLSKLNKLENISKLSELEQLRKLDKLDSLSELHKLSKLDKLSELEVLDKISHLCKVDHLDDLSKLRELSKLGDISGEVRAIQDFLVGIHQSTLDELKELRLYKQQHVPLNDLLSQKDELQKEVSRLKLEGDMARDDIVALKAELKFGLERLEDCELRYSKLENQLREMMISKYKGILSTGALALLTNNHQYRNDKENSIVVKKRQLRTVSLTER